MRCPAASSSSHACRRGHARASASCANSNVSSSAVTSRDRTSSATTRSRPGSPSRTRLGTRQRTGSPSSDGATRRSRTERTITRCSRSRLSYSRSADRATAPRMPPVSRYPSTVSTFPSRRFHVSTSACESSGRAPGSPSLSRSSTSTRPDSRCRPARSAGCSIASRSASPASGLTRCSPRSARRLSSASTARLPRWSLRTAMTTGPLRVRSTTWARNDRTTSGALPSANSSSNWSMSTGAVGSTEETAPVQAAAGSRAGVNSDRDATALLQRRRNPRPQQRRLPASGRSGQDDQRARPQPFEAGGDLGVAAEEALRVALDVRHEALVRARLVDTRRLRRRSERRVLAQNRQLERGELRARIETELLGQRAAGDPDRLQRVGLAPAAVARERQDRPAALPPRFLGDERLGFDRHLPVLAGREPRVEQVLLDRATRAPPAAPPRCARAARRQARPAGVPATATTPAYRRSRRGSARRSPQAHGRARRAARSEPCRARRGRAPAGIRPAPSRSPTRRASCAAGRRRSAPASATSPEATRPTARPRARPARRAARGGPRAR